MSSFIPFDRSQPYLLPPDLKSWLPADDMAHFVAASIELVPMNAFCVPVRTGGKAQYHPRLILALLIFSHANGLFSLRRIERATYRDIGVRVSWRRTCIWITTRLPLFGGRTGQPLKRHLRRSCFWRETGLLRPGVVLIDGTKIDADASKYRSLRYDRIRALREQLAADISRN